MRIDVTRYSDIGGRAENEDSTLYARGGSFIVAAVADGLGGHGGGAIASSEALIQLGRSLPELEQPSEAGIRSVCESMNGAVRARQTQGLRMKTTLAMALLYENGTTALAHIGDSRIYHFRNGGILYRSLDHSVSQLAVLAGEITEDQIRFHEDRNRVLRVLGGEDAANPDVRITENNILPGDAFLLGTDGFWEYVLEADMLELLALTKSSKDWLVRMYDLVEQKAPEGHDNNSAVAIRIHGGRSRRHAG